MTCTRSRPPLVFQNSVAPARTEMDLMGHPSLVTESEEETLTHAMGMMKQMLEAVRKVGSNASNPKSYAAQRCQLCCCVRAFVSIYIYITQRRGKRSFVNNGGTRDLKRNEPLRDCDLSLNLVGSASNALFSALEPNDMRTCLLGPCHVCTSCNLLYLWAINVIVIIDSPLIDGTEGVSWAHYHANLKSSLHHND